MPLTAAKSVHMHRWLSEPLVPKVEVISSSSWLNWRLCYSTPPPEQWRPLSSTHSVGDSSNYSTRASAPTGLLQEGKQRPLVATICWWRSELVETSQQMRLHQAAPSGQRSGNAAWHRRFCWPVETPVETLIKALKQQPETHTFPLTACTNTNVHSSKHTKVSTAGTCVTDWAKAWCTLLIWLKKTSNQALCCWNDALEKASSRSQSDADQIISSIWTFLQTHSFQ